MLSIPPAYVAASATTRIPGSQNEEVEEEVAALTIAPSD